MGRTATVTKNGNKILMRQAVRHVIQESVAQVQQYNQNRRPAGPTTDVTIAT